jgi:hypothetical protein
MKKWLLILLLPLSLQAEDGGQPQCHPFALSGTYVNVTRAKFREPKLAKQSIHYQQWDNAFGYTHSVSPNSGFIFGSGWISSRIDMVDNPNFDETLFNYVNFSVAGFTTVLPKWVWMVTAAAYLDMDNFSFIDYALYQGILWGRYDFSDKIEFDFGLIVELGLRKEKLWPLIGFIYYPADRFSLSVIYPVDISLEYEICPTLSVEGAMRFLRNRHRVGQSEPNPQAIFEYRSSGFELDLNYTPFRSALLTGFIGSTFRGNFQVSDHNHDHTHHYKFKNSLYTGFTAAVNF